MNKRIFFLLAFVLINPLQQTFSSEELFPKYYIYLPTSYYHKKNPEICDIGTIISNTEAEKYKNKILSTKDFDIISKNYFNILEKYIENECAVDKSFIEKLKAKPKIRKAFLSALSPYYDNISESCAILANLLETYPALSKKYYHLAIALAVVWDTPDAIQSSRYYCLWGYTAENFKETPAYQNIFEFYTKKKNLKSFVFNPAKLPWPVLIHIADYDITIAERKWIQKKYYSKRKSTAQRYSEVKYDNQKLITKIPNLGTRSYTLMNILTYNGICGDRAHFASRIAKTFAIPAMKVSGKGRYGGYHAWAGFLVEEKGVPVLKFSGRYRGDMYYTGKIFDPQTRTLTLDRYVQQMYAAAAKSYTKYNKSLIAKKIGDLIFVSNPELSFALAEFAIKSNPKARPGWQLLLRHIKAGSIETNIVKKYLNLMVKELKHFPDSIMQGVEVMMAYLPKDNFEKRGKIYQSAMKKFKKRPDLQIKLRIAQCKELVKAGKSKKAIRIAMKTCIDNAKESVTILPLVKRVVEIAKEKGFEKQAFKYFTIVEKNFPKKRGNKPSKAYSEFKTLLAELK